MNRATLLLALAACAPSAPPAQAHFDAFAAGRTGELWAKFGPKLRDHFGSERALRDFRDRAFEFLGPEQRILDERRKGSISIRRSLFEKYEHPVELQVRIGRNEEITGFRVIPTEFSSYEPHVRLHLPFAGAWRIMECGRGIDENFHPGIPTTTFAYDFQRVEHGNTHANDGAANTDYYSFGQTVLAPAGGIVVKVVQDVADHAPGVRDHEDSKGNYVVIGHGHDEFSLLSKLAQHSVIVNEGDEVLAGQPIALSGNSGHAKQPHLHYHLQNKRGQGLPARFYDYLADQKLMKSGEPRRGQIVEVR